MTIEDVMYGLTPSMTIERRARPPTEKIFKRPKNWLFAKNAARAPLSTPGTGMTERKRKSANAPMRNRTRLRISESLKASFTLRMKVLIMDRSPGSRDSRTSSARKRAVPDHERFRECACGKNFHHWSTTFRSADQTLRKKCYWRHRLPRQEGGFESREAYRSSRNAICLDCAGTI